MRPCISLIAVLLAALMVASSAAADQTERLTYVSATGSDSGVCARTAPCRTFNYAKTQTLTRGEIHVLDSGDFGYVSLDRAMTIDGENHTARVGDSTHTVGIAIAPPTPSKILLRDLRLNGTRDDTTYVIDRGVRISNAGTVTLDDVRLSGFATAGVSVDAASGSSRVIVKHSSLDDNGAGIIVAPTGSTTARLTVRDTDIDDNGVGVQVLTTGGQPSTAYVQILDSAITESGISPVASGWAVRADGPRSIARISHNEIQGNRVGLSVANSGQILSAGDNRVFSNLSNGAPTGSLGSQM